MNKQLWLVVGDNNVSLYRHNNGSWQLNVNCYELQRTFHSAIAAMRYACAYLNAR